MMPEAPSNHCDAAAAAGPITPPGDPICPVPLEEPSENPDLMHAGRSTMLHNLFGRHRPNLETSHWELGYFVTTCTTCRRAMVKLPGLPWRLRALVD